MKVGKIIAFFIFLMTANVYGSQEKKNNNERQNVAVLHEKYPRETKAVFSGSVRKHKNKKKIEVIPADDSLKRDQFSEAVEEELGSAGIGKHVGNRRRRRGHNKRSCIYIDIPGSNREDEVDIIIPGSLTRSTATGNIISNEILQVDAQQQKLIATQSESPNLNSSPNEEIQKETDSGVDAADSKEIYWLKLPPTENVGSRQILLKLYEVVNSFHRSGKDVLFVPISKGYVSTDEAKEGFIRTLPVNPIQMKKDLQIFEIK